MLVSVSTLCYKSSQKSKKKAHKDEPVALEHDCGSAAIVERLIGKTPRKTTDVLDNGAERGHFCPEEGPDGIADQDSSVLGRKLVHCSRQ